MTDFNPYRRKFVMSGAALTAGTLLLPSTGWAQHVTNFGTRELSLVNAHTNEAVSDCYFDGNNYVPSVLDSFNHLCRDFRRNEAIALDPKLYDQLVAIKALVGSSNPCIILSGYRSKKTNDMLRRRGGGQALHSYHIKGQAIDFMIEGVPLKKLRKAAMSLKAGGVGYYSRSHFIHIDTGPVRHWG
ncbi:DUF882 domain-containing protein [Veronia pacifica]|uniref:Murein endopeptidase K n=1 Tax=Veronia pacifica TaxID=1080227 RepID=A0A1C3EDZ7_9GAMM|nr:DUF882 domain-containing protein [Veronia pacifica]ODA31466.1 hypothetical protein A8L45_16920 [Veronia pacifica]